ncbi:histidine phosphatase family protein [Pseudomonas sp.]|uniref:histidine phosphatase family protein n=1 Tax=Pseudomonas sp. TaxID=306 RepID=UPI00261548D0|nr:histidine phosphatase family protein [Pseudomonas sp.]
MPIRLSFICHARTEAQRLGRFALDETVDPKELEKARQLASTLKKTVRILCAPETRALQTAQALGGEIEIVPALEDYDMGDWKGLSLADLQQIAPDALAHWINTPLSAAPNGESVHALCARISTWLSEFREDGHFAVVTHPFVIRAAVLHALAASTASFNLIDVEPLSRVELRLSDRWRLRL